MILPPREVCCKPATQWVKICFFKGSSVSSHETEESPEKKHKKGFKLFKKGKKHEKHSEDAHVSTVSEPVVSVAKEDSGRKQKSTDTQSPAKTGASATLHDLAEEIAKDIPPKELGDKPEGEISEVKNSVMVETPEVEKPGVEDHEIGKPGVEDHEVEKPGVEDHEVEKPGVEDHEVEKPGIVGGDGVDSAKETQVSQLETVLEENIASQDEITVEISPELEVPRSTHDNEVSNQIFRLYLTLPKS